MKRLVWLAGFLPVLLTCGGARSIEPSDACIHACSLAFACGFLPSSLGWVTSSDDPASVVDNCDYRCTNAVDTPANRRLVECLTLPEQNPYNPFWCENGPLLQCGQVADCLLDSTSQELGVNGAIGVSDLLVTLINYDLYTNRFSSCTGASTEDDDRAACQEAESSPYENAFPEFEKLQNPSDPALLNTCNAALCAPALCNLEVPDLCSYRLCNSDVFSTQITCQQLGIVELELGVEQALLEGPARVVSQRITAGENESVCSNPSVVFSGAQYGLRAGPVVPFVRIRGLAPEALTDLICYYDTLNDDDICDFDEDTSTESDTLSETETTSDESTDSVGTDGATSDGETSESNAGAHMTLPHSQLQGSNSHTRGSNMDVQYCMKFYGPRVIIRAGSSQAIVPLPNLDLLAKLASEKFQLTACD